jgi:hypothetical protein
MLRGVSRTREEIQSPETTSGGGLLPDGFSTTHRIRGPQQKGEGSEWRPYRY